MPESLDQEIRTLRAQYWSGRDPEGRAFAPLADAYRRRGELDEAVSLVEDGLGRLPEFATGHVVASRVARDRGDLVAARNHLDRVLALDPENMAALLERAEMGLEEGDRDGAIGDLGTLIGLDPGHEEALSWMKAVETADLPPEAPGAGPEPGEPSLQTRTMGDLYARQGLRDRAVEVYRHLVERNPEDEGLARRLDELLSLEGTPTSQTPSETGSGSGRGPDLDERQSQEPAAPTPAPGAELPISRYFEDLLAWVPGAVPIASLAPDPEEGGTEPGPTGSQETSPDHGDGTGSAPPSAGSPR